jgi:hypothetical protein
VSCIRGRRLQSRASRSVPCTRTNQQHTERYTHRQAKDPQEGVGSKQVCIRTVWLCMITALEHRAVNIHMVKCKA